MRKLWKVWAIALGLVSALGAAAYAVHHARSMEFQQTVVPGTGVSLALPKGVTAPPFGTTFANKDASINVIITTGPSANNPFKRGVLAQAFSPTTEAFHSATLDGTLLHRTRKVDGGGWDGWALYVVRGPRILTVMIGYNGTDEAVLGELKEILNTVSWDEHVTDPEAAFGLRVNPPGQQLVPGATGGLDYSASGRVNTYEPHLNLTASPIRFNGDPETFRQLCERTASIAFKDRLPAPLQYTKTNGILLCDTSENYGHNDSDYYASIEFPDGATAVIRGRGDPNALRQALLDAKQIPR